MALARALPGALLVLWAAVLASCGDDFPAFGVDVDIDRQTIPGFLDPPLSSCDEITNQVLGPDGALIPFSVDFEDEEELEGVDLTSLERVVLERIVIDIVDEAPGDSDTFDFIDSLRIFVDDPNDARPEVLVAVLDPVPNGRKRIVIPGTGVDLREIARDEFLVRGEAVGRPPCDDVHIVGELEFEVTLF